MIKNVLHKFAVSLLLSRCLSVYSAGPEPSYMKGSKSIEIDSTQNLKKYNILKINPFQILLCEIPISFETFIRQDKSIQFQIGFIFPLSDDSKIREEYEKMLHENTSTNEENYSYRKSPFCNYGLSFKTELRKYGRRFYYAPQLMYKYSFYNEETFEIYGGGRTLDQTESKDSNIFGLGFMIGRQSYKRNFVTDWYAGAGLRLDFTSVMIIKIQNPTMPSEVVYPNRTENSVTVYPFINFGLRLGIKL